LAKDFRGIGPALPAACWFTKKYELYQLTHYMFNGQMSFLNVLSVGPLLTASAIR
jgi:hypothetical protein